jgi:cell division protein FtsL
VSPAEPRWGAQARQVVREEPSGYEMVHSAQVYGAEINGAQIYGDQPDGAQFDGDQIDGDQIDGDQFRRDQFRRDQFRGDQSRGDQSRGDQSRGDQFDSGQFDSGQFDSGQFDSGQFDSGQFDSEQFGSSQPARHDGQERRRHLHLVSQQARRRANRRHLLISVAIAGLAVVCLSLVAVHVLMAENQFTLDHLQQQATAQQERYEKLRLNVAELESPSRIVSVAEGKLGMQQPGSVTYLPATSGSSARGGTRPKGVAGGTASNAGSRLSGGSGPGATVAAPQGDADWPDIKQYLSGSP